MAAQLDFLRNARVLVVEDETLLAMNLVDELERADAFVLGPAASVTEAMNIIHTWQVDAAILDIELQGAPVYPVADVLRARGVPFVFTTGHDADILPARFAHAPVCTKPAPASEALAMLAEGVVGEP